MENKAEILKVVEGIIDEISDTKQENGKLQQALTDKDNQLTTQKTQIENLEKYKESYIKLKARLEEKDKLLAEKDTRITKLSEINADLRQKLVLANRLTEEQKAKGQQNSIKSSQQHAAQEQERIAYVIDSWIKNKARGDFMQRVDMQFVLAHTKASKSTVYDFIHNKELCAKYSKYAHFYRFVVNFGKFQNT